MLSTTAIYVFALTTFCGLLAWAAVTDFRRYIIPNHATLAVLVLYPVYVLSAPESVSWQFALVMGLVFFVVGFVMYLGRALGAGDAKLLPVVILWVSPKGFVLFLVVMLGASFVLAGIVGIRTALAQIRASEAGAGAAGGTAVVLSPFARLGRLLSELRHVPFLKIQVPYGVAISAGGICFALNSLFTTLR